MSLDRCRPVCRKRRRILNGFTARRFRRCRSSPPRVRRFAPPWLRACLEYYAGYTGGCVPLALEEEHAGRPTEPDGHGDQCPVRTGVRPRQLNRDGFSSARSSRPASPDEGAHAAGYFYAGQAPRRTDASWVILAAKGGRRNNGEYPLMRRWTPTLPARWRETSASGMCRLRGFARRCDGQRAGRFPPGRDADLRGKPGGPAPACRLTRCRRP